MKNSRQARSVIAFVVSAILGAALFNDAVAGRIVVANDDWTLSNIGFVGTNDPGVFATNIASWFTDGAAGSFLVYSNHFGLTGSSLATAMTAAGHQWLVDTSVSFDLATLTSYDAVFVGLLPADNTVLTQYVNASGSVYVMGGGNPGEDPALWNSFLQPFGLQFGNPNNVNQNVSISSPHPIFSGVDSLLNINGTTIIDTDIADVRNQILVTDASGGGLYGVFDPTPIPVPGAAWLLGTGLIALAGFRGRSRSKSK